MLFILVMNQNLILIHTSGDISNNVHYIIPSPNVPCPEESCLTLSTLADNSSYIDTDTTIIFLDGNHTLDSGLTISNIHRSLMLLTNGTVAIFCNDGANLAFYDITQLQINGIEFIGCSCNVELVGQLTLENCRFYGESNNSALELVQTNTSIVQSSFVSNTAGTYSDVGVLTYMRNNPYNFSYVYWPDIQSNSTRVGGALIVTNSTVNINNSNFENNSAKVGGAIFAEEGSNLSICNCTFVSNSATGRYSSTYNSYYYYYYNDGSCHGGALFIDNGCSVTAHNSTFIDNSAGYSGGAIALFQVSEALLGSGQNVFSGNRGGIFGGAISAIDGSRITIDSSCYSNNTGRYGGVIYMDRYASITVCNSSFENNEAGSSGGVVYASSSISITVGNSSFENNEAGGNGGVVYASSSSSITVGNSSFENNEAGGSGGFVYASSSSSILVGNSSFENNEAGSSGGVVYASSSISITVGNSSFENNEAGSSGGVVYASSSISITVGNSSFENNEAGGSGGVVYASSSSSITVGNSSFENNEAGSSGGVVYASSSISITVGNSSFENNEAGGSGGVVYASSNSSITVGNSSFESNEAGGSGGVVYAFSSSSITVGNSSFENDEAGSSGGVVYASSSSSITMGDSSFENNEAGSGGVIYAVFSNIDLGNSSFDNNEANTGGVLLSVNGDIITVSNSFFDNNRAHLVAGVFVLGSSNIIVESSSFDNNTAGRYGGVMYTPFSSNITVSNSSFHSNSAEQGGVVYASSGLKYYITIMYLFSVSIDDNNIIPRGVVTFQNNCRFYNNSAIEGGAAYVDDTKLMDTDNIYFGNKAANGGVFVLAEGVVKVRASMFTNNTARNGGGVLYTPLNNYEKEVILEASHFFDNSAMRGGAIAIFSTGMVTMIESIFTNNNAIRGGAIYLFIRNNITATYNNFSGNLAQNDGGMIFSEYQNQLNFKHCIINYNGADNNGGAICLLSQSKLNFSGDNSFHGNQALIGGVIYAVESIINVHSQSLLMTNNTAIVTGGAIYLSIANLTFFGGNTSFIQNQAQNGGALHVTNGRIEAHNKSLLMANNTARDSGGAVFLYKTNLSFTSVYNKFIGNKAITGHGGAIYLGGGQVIFSDGNVILITNIAIDGGAIFISNSQLVIESDSQLNIIEDNSAAHRGGGLYLITSEMRIRGEYSLTRNTANNNGGGIHATNSSMIIEGTVHLVGNEAENGGGVSLERNAKLSGLISGDDHIINFIKNEASRYGGAIYVDDETNPDMCATLNGTSSTECFLKSLYINMLDNTAGMSGSDLFGGLLDRCSVYNEASMEHQFETGIMMLINSRVSNINESQPLDTVTSHPVRLCFCRDGQPDCNYQPEPIKVNRGKVFFIELIAYDQVYHSVHARIQCSINSSVGVLGEEERIQDIDNNCTELKYNIFTRKNNYYEGLSFFAVKDPCNNTSMLSVVIEIICSCPIGFQPSNYSDTSCDCACHLVLQSYQKIECNPETETIIRRENFWISYINHTISNSSGYLIYSHCPFDYCYTPDKGISVNLNLPNGSDAQCNSNRMGTLCGTCKSGLSVSLGSSKCVQCPHYWPGLLVTIAIAFIISGIGLVAFLLLLNPGA